MRTVVAVDKAFRYRLPERPRLDRRAVIVRDRPARYEICLSGVFSTLFCDISRRRHPAFIADHRSSGQQS
jgi:hypothetical protein